jgi:hypothetical protein
MQLIEQFYAVDEEHQVHTVAVYKQAFGMRIYRLDDRESVELLDEKWFVTQAGDVLERVLMTQPRDSIASDRS